MRKAGVDWHLVSYGGAVHNFTHWGSGGRRTGSKALPTTRERTEGSWEALKKLLREIFR